MRGESQLCTGSKVYASISEVLLRQRLARAKLQEEE